ncbi:MAG: SpoIIE family protein phosphatase [Planctomycetota bacterium]
MTVALAVVLVAFSLILLRATREIVETAVDDALDQAAVAQSEADRGELAFEQTGREATSLGDGYLRTTVRFTEGERTGESGYGYWREQEPNRVVSVAPLQYAEGDPVKDLYSLFFAMTLLTLIVAALVALGVATRVAKPIEALVDDVRSIANGHLDLRVRAQGGGEVALLGNAMDRMTQSLREAQDAEVELSVREREREVALEVQEALRPAEMPAPDGYEVASEHVGSAEPGGDFHDVVETTDGRTIYFACDVSGTGVPGALVGAMARAYLKSALREGGQLEETLKGVNRTLAAEVKRGMYVTALAAALDPVTHELEVASAGHKLPLVLWAADDDGVRAVQPDGIALGFDKGPVFDRSISVRNVPLAPGDRVAIAGTGAVRVTSPDGEELGEKRFYRLFKRSAPEAPADCLDALLTGFEAFADGEPFPADVSLIVLGRAS